MHISKEKISSVILKIRVSKGYSQTYLAHKLGISQKAYSNLESGLSKVDLVRFLKIAHYTETHPHSIIDKIISGQPSWMSNNSKDDAYVDHIQKLVAEIKYLKSENQFLRETINKLTDK